MGGFTEWLEKRKHQYQAGPEIATKTGEPGLN
jgi:hypothetical protein